MIEITIVLGELFKYSADFQPSRFYPEAHRFQEDETEQLLRAARALHRINVQLELLKFKQNPTREIRKWLSENGGHSTWREQVALLEALKGKRPSASRTPIPPLNDDEAFPAKLSKEQAATFVEGGRIDDLYDKYIIPDSSDE